MKVLLLISQTTVQIQFIRQQEDVKSTVYWMLSVKDGNTVVKPAAAKLVVRTNLNLCYESLPGPRSIESDEKKRASERELVGSPFENWKKKKKAGDEIFFVWF